MDHPKQSIKTSVSEEQSSSAGEAAKPAEKVKVLSSWVSMFGLRVLIALKAKGIEYEYQEEDLRNKSQLLLSRNPIHKKIPVLIHNGKTICESLIIIQYIDEVWPNPEVSFLPTDPYHRAQARFWADYIDKKMYDVGSRIIRSQEGTQRELAKTEMIEIFLTLDGAFQELSAGGQFFGGEKLGLVDIALAPFICWFEAYEILGAFRLPTESQCPYLLGWVKRIARYPIVKQACEIAPQSKVTEFAKMIRDMFEPHSY